MALSTAAKAATACGVLVVLAAAWFVSGNARDPASVPSSSGAITVPGGSKLLSAQECAKSLVCTAPKFMKEAGAPCRKAIEDLAAYAPRWEQASTDRMFRDYAWLDAAKGTITYQGNEAQFQNAGGVWQPVAYECDYDPATKQVIEARAKGAAGR